MPLARWFAAVLRPDILAAVMRFPVPTAASALATVLTILTVEDRISGNSESLEQLLYGAAVAFAAGVAAAILLDGRGRRPALAGQLAALALGACAGLVLHSLWLTPAMLVAGLALLTVAAPGFAAGGTAMRFWIVNMRSGFAALVGAVGAGAFVLGLWAILATLHSLFDTRVPDRIVAHAAAIGFILVLPLYWLAVQPRVQAVDDEKASDSLLRAVAALTDFVFLPLLVTYAAILHVYAAKIAIDAALPRGQIGWMVSTFLALGYAAFLLAVPRQSPLPRLREIFRRAWPPATLLPVGLLALALWERVQAYGVTEERYLLALVAIVAPLLVVLWAPKRRLDPRLPPAVAAGLLLIAAVGPAAARFLTVHSQAKRMIAVLESSGEMSNGRFEGRRTTPWGEETRRDLQTIIFLLETKRALHLIAPAVGEELAANPRTLRARLGLDGQVVARPQPTPAILPSVRIDSDLLLGRFVASEIDTRPLIFRAPPGPDYTLNGKGRQLVLSGPAGTFTFDPSALGDQRPLPETGFDPALATPAPLVRADDPRAVLILRGIRWQGSGAERTFAWLSAEILLRNVQP